MRLPSASFVAAAAVAFTACGAQAGSGGLGAVDTPTIPLPVGVGPHQRARGETWYLDADGTRLVLALGADGKSGTVTDEATGIVDRADAIVHGKGSLAFARVGADGTRTPFVTRTVAGVLAGRFGDGTRHVTGWQAEVFDGPPVPRVWEVDFSDGSLARLRVDRDADQRLVGRLKVYANVNAGDDGADGEQWSHDVAVRAWDGSALDVVDDQGREITAQVVGRRLVGTRSDGATLVGARAEVLSFGLEPRGDRAAWQAATRARLERLMMDGAPAPLSSTVTELGERDPFPSTDPPPERDDDFADHPQDYRLHELGFAWALPSPVAGGPPLRRVGHGWMAVPNGAPPTGGWPIVLAVNGHGGSAQQVFWPDEEHFWYGDAWARRGYLVLAVDISHRPVADRAALYTNVPDGDDPSTGNGPHPAIEPDGSDSNWEEDGERTWDVMRTLDWVLGRSDVNRTQVVVTGLSMGGEIATWVVAMDPRVAVGIPAGYSPDMGVMIWNGNHPCWQWQHGDIREYLDVSDLHALAAPRGLVVETGQIDPIFSRADPPFAGDKQVMRRTLAAYDGDLGHVLHYLHDDEHHWHAGVATGLLGTAVTAPTPSEPWQWQVDPSTDAVAPSLFDLTTTWLQGDAP